MSKTNWKWTGFFLGLTMLFVSATFIGPDWFGKVFAGYAGVMFGCALWACIEGMLEKRFGRG